MVPIMADLLAISFTFSHQLRRLGLTRGKLRLNSSRSCFAVLRPRVSIHFEHGPRRLLLVKVFKRVQWKFHECIACDYFEILLTQFNTRGTTEWSLKTIFVGKRVRRNYKKPQVHISRRVLTKCSNVFFKKLVRNVRTNKRTKFRRKIVLIDRSKIYIYIRRLADLRIRRIGAYLKRLRNDSRKRSGQQRKQQLKKKNRSRLARNEALIFFESPST